MGRTRWVIVLLVAGCSAPAPVDEDAAPAPDPALSELTCVELQQRIQAALPEVDRRCDDVDDCVVFGAAWSCDCTPHLAPGCSGLALNRGAVTTHPVVGPASREFGARCLRNDGATCDQLGCSCDCYPARPGCVAGRCEAVEERSCFGL